MLTTEVENFPGFPEGIKGPELMTRCREQASRFGAQFITEKVTRVDFSARPFKAWVRDTLYTADSVIVSTGANIVDQDFFEALGFRHYQGSPAADDNADAEPAADETTEGD